MAETCHQGACTGALKSGVAVYFKDDFSGAFRWTRAAADAGIAWTARPAVSIEWQQNGREPERDHTATLDGMMAACNDCVEGDLMESPVIDTSLAKGELWVNFWSALIHRPQAAAGASTVAMVAVYDGAKWVEVWGTPYGHASNEWTWHPITVNATKYKNKDFKLRIGFAPPNAGTRAPGSTWFVDDVTVSNRPCAPAASSGGGTGNGN
jgi:hypothetical protein